MMKEEWQEINEELHELREEIAKLRAENERLRDELAITRKYIRDRLAGQLSPPSEAEQ